MVIDKGLFASKGYTQRIHHEGFFGQACEAARLYPLGMWQKNQFFYLKFFIFKKIKLLYNFKKIYLNFFRINKSYQTKYQSYGIWFHYFGH